MADNAKNLGKYLHAKKVPKPEKDKKPVPYKPAPGGVRG